MYRNKGKKCVYFFNSTCVGNFATRNDIKYGTFATYSNLDT